jgi:transcriptional regulator with XRE-family HTH domain
MENYGLIIRRLRGLSGLDLRATARKIERSVGWLSEVENGKGKARLTEPEFNRIVDLLNGQRHRPMFRTWAAAHKKRDKTRTNLEGAVLKYIRTKKELSLKEAAHATSLSYSYLSKLETGEKPVTLDMRNRILAAYGYSSSSWKNLATDPVRSKAVPQAYKLRILLSALDDQKIEAVFHFVQSLVAGPTLPGGVA